ncbi:MAG TPA: hypothetical protein VK691_00955 [Solirubrobacteraceae bacterium]|nr:hypothetical protein [Solirubrobacteraceae bacterium]
MIPRRARDVRRRAHPAAHTSGAVALALASVLLVAGCGGGARLNAGEPAGTYAVKVIHASFPTRQAIARPTSFELEVENTGAHTVPNIAVTVDSFDYASNYAELAADKRPVWAIERGPGAIASPPVNTQEVSQPGGGQTAYVNTWALGALAPGRTRTFVWHVVPVEAGAHTVRYSVAAGLAGKAKARLASGASVEGQFAVNIAAAPELKHVNPATGRLEGGEFPATP